MFSIYPEGLESQPAIEIDTVSPVAPYPEKIIICKERHGTVVIGAGGFILKPDKSGAGSPDSN